jgi:enoyl-CoA hydratase/carnithine racemase
MQGPLKISRHEGTLRLTLNNPPANALSIGLLELIQTQLDDVRRNEAVRVVVLSAEGKLFSAGHDLKEMTARRADPDRGRSYFEQTFALCSRMMQSIVELPQPVIAEVDGIATAAGCQLVASCDLAYASDRARFGVNGINLGLFCSTPAVALTRNVPIKRAMEMLLTGEMIDAATALDIGLVNRVVPSSSLPQVVDETASAIASKSRVALQLGKRAVHEQANMTLADAYDCASRAIIENMLTADAAEGIGAFLNKRQSGSRDA